MAVIWWMRRDLRLSDNVALDEALATGEPVVPLFVADPAILGVRNMGAARLHFCFQSVLEVNARLLEADAGYVVIRHGDPLDALRDVAARVGATRVFVNRDYTPLARRRDERVREGLADAGIELHRFKDLVLFETDEILTKSKEKPYEVYGPYQKRWRGMEPPPVIGPDWPDVPALRTPRGIACDPLPTLEALGFELEQTPQAAGERAARARLDEWVDLRRSDSVAHYAEQRERPAVERGTSRLSPHLRFGTLSPRTAYAAAMAARDRTEQPSVRESIDVWLSELAWRDFYYQLLYHHPRLLTESFTQRYDRLAWLSDEAALEAWKIGRTGYPYIDAGMRQMRAIAWMHNRLRMAVASFLTKDLLYDWRPGYHFFMERLVDADPANNNGGWQWAASTGGPSAQPYFRVFNPVQQGKKHDPDGEYVRRWVPELRDVPTAHIHEPWKMSEAEQRAAGCIIGEDYPAPIVDHDERRDRAIALYKEAG